MSSRRGVRVGAAAFALGLSLAGPQGLGVATADSADTDTSTGGARGSQSTPAAETSASAGRRAGRSASKPAPAAGRANGHNPQPATTAVNPLLVARQAAVPTAPRLVFPAAAARAARGAAALPPVAVLSASAAVTADDPIASVAGSVSDIGSEFLGLMSGGGDGGPMSATLAWAALAVSRREIGARAGGAKPATTVSTGEPSDGAARTASLTAEADRPFVQSVSLPRAGTYGTGTTMTFTLSFNEPVQVIDTSVFVPVQVGFAMRNAQYVSGSGTSKLTFQLTTTATDYGAVAIGRVSNQLEPGATAPVRIFDFQGMGHQQSAAEVQNAKIIDAQGNPVSDTIPALDTGAITVDARAAAVVSYGSNGANTTISTWTGPLGLMHLSTLQVKFDSAVRVTGAPTVPVTIAGAPGVLTYTSGSGTSTLTFSKLTFGADPGPVAFPDDGQIINLPLGANITDTLGNSVAIALDNFGVEPGTLGPPLVENGNRIVVLGAHYQYLGEVSATQLNDVLGPEAKAFYEETTTDPYTGQDPASYWAAYKEPAFVAAIYGVDLYRVAYNSTIPEQNNRPTLAYGLVAIPQSGTETLKLMSYQHGTLVGKGETPSQSFNWMLNPTGSPYDALNAAHNLYAAAYETRLNVAQFGGLGYAVMAADYFGVGNSLENDGYISKASQQQACLDMYYASMKLLEAKGHPVSDLYLGGWSQGGLVTVDFLEKLQSEGISVTKAATASAPANVKLTSDLWYFHPRPFTPPPPEQVNTPDAIWLNVVGELSNFSVPGYAEKYGSPLQMLGVNYEVSRAMYMRQYDALSFVPPVLGGTGITVHRAGLADAVLPYKLSEVIAPEYANNQALYAQTDYATLLAAQGAGSSELLTTPLGMYYGSQDEVIPVEAGVDVDVVQKRDFQNPQIWAVGVNAANHRGTFLASVAGELEWFLGRTSTPQVIAPTQGWPLP